MRHITYNLLNSLKLYIIMLLNINYDTKLMNNYKRNTHDMKQSKLNK